MRDPTIIYSIFLKLRDIGVFWDFGGVVLIFKPRGTKTPSPKAETLDPKP